MDKFIFDLDYTLYGKRDNICEINTQNYYNSFSKKPFLTQLFQELNKKYFLFTNGNSIHADFVLKKMGIKNFFPNKKILARDKMDELLKPNPRTYDICINKFNIHPKDTIYFFEDTIVNLQEAKKYGWITILINDKQIRPKVFDYVFPHIDFSLLFFLFTNKLKNGQLNY